MKHRQEQSPGLTLVKNMAELFLGKVLLKNNRDQDELDTDQEIWQRLENRVLLLYFAESGCSRCQEFAPLLKDFFTKLTDEFYVNRSSQLALVYVSLDRTEEDHESFIKDMPKRWLVIPFEDEEFRRDLEIQFSVSEVPVLVVLKPSGQIISLNAVDEVTRLGPSCFQNWQEASEIIDRSFVLPEFTDSTASRSVTDPIRRIKYKLEDTKKKKERPGRDDDDDGGGGGGGGTGFF
ncbi:nucleoredoxin-like protein 1 isoform X2 [Hyla sarda]|uniref:nucleoredoxin-like protein 1 isoform X2 n=1 Tax=Hyla sarda TaxID=327740 RepID=UPI0024C3CE99|nr:nucleoredoxin-like protein 1 isoform X2 [Hyla sarda]